MFRQDDLLRCRHADNKKRTSPACPALPYVKSGHDELWLFAALTTSRSVILRNPVAGAFEGYLDSQMFILATYANGAIGLAHRHGPREAVDRSIQSR